MSAPTPVPYIASCALHGVRESHTSARMCSDLGSTDVLLEFERRPRFPPTNSEDGIELPWFQPGERRGVPLDILAASRLFKQSLPASLCNVSGNILVGFLGEDDVERRNETVLVFSKVARS